MNNRHKSPPTEGQAPLTVSTHPEVRCAKCRRWLVRREGLDLAFHVRFIRVTPPEFQAWGMCPRCKLQQPLPLTLLR